MVVETQLEIRDAFSEFDDTDEKKNAFSYASTLKLRSIVAIFVYSYTTYVGNTC